MYLNLAIRADLDIWHVISLLFKIFMLKSYLLLNYPEGDLDIVRS